MSVNNDIPSVWFLENSWGKIILRRFGHKGQTLRRKTTFQISGCPTGLIQFYFLVYVVSGDGRKGSGLILSAWNINKLSCLARNGSHNDPVFFATKSIDLQCK